MRSRLSGPLVLAVVCMTTAIAVGVTPALAAASSTTTPTTASSTTTTPTTASTASTPASSAVTPPAFGLGNAQNNELSTPQTTSTPVVTTSSTGSGGLSGTDAVIIGLVVLALLVAISVYVLRDARARTAKDPDVSDDPFADKRKGSKAPPKSRKLKPAERKRRKRGRAPRKRW
jgi:hypothetical protein